MKVIMLSGGLGTRLSEETVIKPKPMVEIGGKPILWHIMMGYATQGYKEFVLALGYKGEMIKSYFLNFYALNNDLTISLINGGSMVHHQNTMDWTVHLIDTGNATQTGGRIKRLRKHLGQEPFMLTYGDGVADIRLDQLLAFHRSHGKLATVTVVRPPSRFGGVELESNGKVVSFAEKSQAGEGWINGGFFVLEPSVLEYIEGDDTAWERAPMERLAAEGQLMAFRHEGFWQPMDTLREKNLLEDLAERKGSMEDLGMTRSLREAFDGRAVLLTGHTGFKGSWLAIWLHQLGARVSGYSLPPPTEPSNFVACRVRELLHQHEEADLRDLGQLERTLRACQPDVIFHLAAQSLVRESYASPLETFEVNVMGTANLLEAVRRSGRPCAVIVVTSDKCYENREWEWSYRENDPVGGHDPYSGSKGAAEIVVQSFRRSFFNPDRLKEHGIKMASVRAGNVIGGGDSARDRIVPDIVSHLSAGKAAPVRNPSAVRPWQHVLEPLYGYLSLAARMIGSDDPIWGSAWNFGPACGDELTVKELVESFIQVWGDGSWKDTHDPSQPHEARTLRLSIEKATWALGWRPRWTSREAIKRSARWYQMFYCEKRASMLDPSLEDIEIFSRRNVDEPAGR